MTLEKNSELEQDHKFRKIYQKMYYGLLKRNFRYISSPFRMLPKFIIIGAVRSGTTSLYYNICEHPNILPASYDEIGFFDVNYDLGLNWYKSMFPLKSENNFSKKNITGEDTPFYFWREDAANRIKKILPHVKLIIILRNPIDRAFSNYHLGVRGGTENLSFDEAISIELEGLEKNEINKENLIKLCDSSRSYIIKSLYYEQMKIWTRKFSKDNLFVTTTEEMSEKPEDVLRKIFEFLQVSPYKISNPQKRKAVKYSKMKYETRQKLVKFFKPHNKQFYELIGHEFKWDV